MSIEDRCKVFGNNLRRIRRDRNMSAQKLSNIIDCEMHTVYVWEWGKSMPSSYLMIRLCEALKVTPNDLYGF